MEIQCIGTGTMGSTTRNNTSILIDSILFDCGMGTVKQLERLGKQIKDIQYLVITHFHADHFFDIPNFLYGKLIRNEFDKKLQILVPASGRRKIIDMMKFTFGNGDASAFEDIEEKYNLEFIELQDTETYAFENYQITALQLHHGSCYPMFGYLLKKEGITIGYTGDTSICDTLYTMCEQANYMFIEATTLINETKGIHISVNELYSIANTYPTCKFYAVHRGDYEIPITDKIVFPKDGDTLHI